MNIYTCSPEELMKNARLPLRVMETESAMYEEMAEIMGQPIPWAPGLPLRADGYETPFYRKD